MEPAKSRFANFRNAATVSPNDTRNKRIGFFVSSARTFLPSFFFSSKRGGEERRESILERINGFLLFHSDRSSFFPSSSSSSSYPSIRSFERRALRIPKRERARGGEGKTIPRFIVVACSPLVSHASRFYSLRRLRSRFNAQQRGSSDLFHFDRGGRGINDGLVVELYLQPLLQGTIPFDARRKRRNRKNAWNRDGNSGKKRNATRWGIDG